MVEFTYYIPANILHLFNNFQWFTSNPVALPDATSIEISLYIEFLSVSLYLL